MKPERKKEPPNKAEKFLEKNNKKKAALNLDALSPEFQNKLLEEIRSVTTENMSVLRTAGFIEIKIYVIAVGFVIFGALFAYTEYYRNLVHTETLAYIKLMHDDYDFQKYKIEEQNKLLDAKLKLMEDRISNISNARDKPAQH